MLPRPWKPGWKVVADAEPNTRSVAFPAVWDGVHVIATATARDGQVDIIPVPGLTLEIPLEAWRGIAPFMTAAALVRRRA